MTKKNTIILTVMALLFVVCVFAYFFMKQYAYNILGVNSYEELMQVQEAAKERVATSFCAKPSGSKEVVDPEGLNEVILERVDNGVLLQFVKDYKADTSDLFQMGAFAIPVDSKPSKPFSFFYECPTY